MTQFSAYNISKNIQDRKKQKEAPKNGVYRGIVRQVLDDYRSGTMMVFIPALVKDPENHDDAVHACRWSSPFAGSTDVRTVGKDIKRYDTGIKSYGMWMQPPDVGNEVLVCFADGLGNQGVVLSVMFPDRLAHMVPGMPLGQNNYGGDPSLPVIERNPNDQRSTHDDSSRPIAVDIAAAITKQGLIKDKIRGPGTSGARRESPSEVFGILTPGPRDPSNWDHRLGGHQFVMDDNLESRLMRLRTAMGNQILMDDTTGIIYVINRDGTAWIEMAKNGDIHMYADGDFNVRAHGNFNVRADKNINLDAGQDINIRAAKDYTDTYAGEGSGTGGNVNIRALEDYNVLSEKHVKITAKTEDMNLLAAKNINVTASEKNVSVKAGKNLQQEAGKDISNKAGKNFIVGSTKAVIKGSSEILLNSGGPAAMPATKAMEAPDVKKNAHKDAGKEAPGFNVQAAVSGTGSVLTSQGKRTGTEDNIESVVTVMPTLEPWQGHAPVSSNDVPGKGNTTSVENPGAI